jgi:hypothetical protein
MHAPDMGTWTYQYDARGHQGHTIESRVYIATVQHVCIFKYLREQMLDL